MYCLSGIDSSKPMYSKGFTIYSTNFSLHQLNIRNYCWHFPCKARVTALLEALFTNLKCGVLMKWLIRCSVALQESLTHSTIRTSTPPSLCQCAALLFCVLYCLSPQHYVRETRTERRFDLSIVRKNPRPSRWQLWMEKCQSFNDITQLSSRKLCCLKTESGFITGWRAQLEFWWLWLALNKCEHDVHVSTKGLTPTS